MVVFSFSAEVTLLEESTDEKRAPLTTLLLPGLIIVPKEYGSSISGSYGICEIGSTVFYSS